MKRMACILIFFDGLKIMKETDYGYTWEKFTQGEPNHENHRYRCWKFKETIL